MNYLEAEDDGHGPVPMEVGAMKGKKGDKKARRVTTKENTARALESTTSTASTARTRSMAKATRKARKKGRKAKVKGKIGRETSTQLELPWILQVMWQVEAQGERVLARLRASSG